MPSAQPAQLGGDQSPPCRSVRHRHCDEHLGLDQGVRSQLAKSVVQVSSSFRLQQKTFDAEAQECLVRPAAMGAIDPQIFNNVFSCYIQQQVTIILPPPENINWLWPWVWLKFMIVLPVPLWFLGLIK